MTKKLRTEFEANVNENTYVSHGKRYKNKYLNIPKKGTPNYDQLRKGDRVKAIIVKTIANKKVKKK